MQVEDNKKRGGRRQGPQPVHREIMMQDQRAKAGVAWAMVRRVKSGFIDMWLVDKNKGDHYVIISLRSVTSLVVPYVKAPTNLKMTESVL